MYVLSNVVVMNSRAQVKANIDLYNGMCNKPTSISMYICIWRTELRLPQMLAYVTSFYRLNDVTNTIDFAFVIRLTFQFFFFFDSCIIVYVCWVSISVLSASFFLFVCVKLLHWARLSHAAITIAKTKNAIHLWFLLQIAIYCILNAQCTHPTNPSCFTQFIGLHAFSHKLNRTNWNEKEKANKYRNYMF